MPAECPLRARPSPLPRFAFVPAAISAAIACAKGVDEQELSPLRARAGDAGAFVHADGGGGAVYGDGVDASDADVRGLRDGVASTSSDAGGATGGHAGGADSVDAKDATVGTDATFAGDGTASTDATDRMDALDSEAAGDEDSPIEVDGTDASAGADDGDDAADAAAPAASISSLGDLIITEVMFDPSGPEPQAEWFEVYNLSTSPKLLSGLTVRDGYPHTHVIASNPPVIAPPGSYVVLVRDRAMAEADFLPSSSVVYEYGAGLLDNEGILLENGAAGSVSLWNDAMELVTVPYGSWQMASVGQSIEIEALQLPAAGSASMWCLAQHTWASGADYGTPGAANDCP